jgi:hypothetical protein
MIMNNDTNDMISEEFPEDNSSSLNKHLQTFMKEKDLDQFRKQLPASFLKDASEGLQQLKDQEQLENILRQLNQQMHGQLSVKKKIRERRAVASMSWTYWAIGVILMLAVIGFILVRMVLKH